MPRIDPYQLLTCLAVLLTPEGGILSQEEVPRLVNLMTKFSKKLVSKCVYILILKNTDRPLVNMFMSEGGWALIHTWLQDAIQISNWDLVKEILGLLLITPVEVERLKLNNIPKLVKGLSRLDNNKGVQELSSQLVQDWLTIVKNNTIKAEESIKAQPVDTVKTEDLKLVASTGLTVDTVDYSQIDAVYDPKEEAIPTTTFYKVTLRDGKQVISRAPAPHSEDDSGGSALAGEDVTMLDDAERIDENDKRGDKQKSRSSRSSSSKHSSSSSKSKSGSSSKYRSSSSSKSSSSSNNKDKDRRDRDKYKDRHRSNGSKSSSSSGSSSGGNKDKEKSESKEKQAEKDKDTLAKIKPQSINKLGRIPKKSADDKSKEARIVKKPTMSIESRKSNEERPKTVKVFHSKRRSTGLEEEAKPPPPRPVKKVTPPSPGQVPAIAPTKRPSPVRDIVTLPEKKPKIDVVPVERPGAIKLIPPKPKPSVLQESDLFMDALAASATTKKETKKRKRRLSVSKDAPGSPPQDQGTPTSPIGLKGITANFYQDTLMDTSESAEITENSKEETSEDNEDTSVREDEDNNRHTPIMMDTSEVEKPDEEISDGAIKGVLLYGKRKGPKKSVRFNDNDLTQVRFFELDETERVNVTKTFMDMAKMEMTGEREALQLSRKVPNEDLMEPQTMWRLPYVLDQKDSLVNSGCKSLEKDIQFAREKSVLQALYFDKRKIPDSPEEPIPENHQMVDPIVIPLEDADSQELDSRNLPWPEPKGSPPHVTLDAMPPQMFSNMPIGPFQNFPPNGPPPPNFPNMGPRFHGMPQPNPGIFTGPHNMMPNGNMMGPPQEMMGPLNPAAFGPPVNNPMMGGDNGNFPMPFNNNPNMGMFPPNNFNMNRGGRGGGFRRGGNNNGPWIRMNGPGPGNWNNNRGPNRGGRLCKNIKNHGFCRNMDKCPFVHPPK